MYGAEQIFEQVIKRKQGSTEEENQNHCHLYENFFMDMEIFEKVVEGYWRNSKKNNKFWWNAVYKTKILQTYLQLFRS